MHVSICNRATGRYVRWEEGLTRVSVGSRRRFETGVGCALKPEGAKVLESWLVKASRCCREERTRLWSGAEGEKTGLLLIWRR